MSAVPHEHVESARDRAFVATPAETGRIVKTGTIWTSAGVIAPGITLGPLLAAHWRPGDLPPVAEVAFWIGTGVAAVGLGLLVWAGCPVLSFDLARAYRQKSVCIRFGSVLNIAGLAIAGLALLLSPA